MATHQIHGLAQTLAEVIQLLPLDSTIVVVAFAESKIDLKYYELEIIIISSITNPGVAMGESPHVVVVATWLPVTAKLEVWHNHSAIDEDDYDDGVDDDDDDEDDDDDNDEYDDNDDDNDADDNADDDND